MAPGSRLQELTAKYMQNPRRFFVPLANEYRVSGDLDRAIALCREHLPAQPGHMSGHIVLGRAYFEKGDHQAARDVFLTSVTLDDENLIALRHLGDIARSRSEVVEARGWYARVLDADPENREIEQLLRSLDSAPADSSGEPPVIEASAPAAAPALPTVSEGADAYEALTVPELLDAPKPLTVSHEMDAHDPVTVPQVMDAAESWTVSGALDAAEPLTVSEAMDAAVAEVPAGAAPAPTADTFGDLASALADPTPPGLRAILGEDTTPAFDAELVRTAPVPPAPVTRTLETFDLSTLGASVEAELDGVIDEPAVHAEASTVAEEFGITVDDGGGFAFSDLDELVDPATAGTAPDTLPPVEEADFSRGVETPSETPAQPPADDILSRPVFGALASFASWRTAQERESPSALPTQPPANMLPPTLEVAAASDDTELFWQGDSTDAAATAPEFVTETMAALYAQQGFTRQALDVYRALLERNPGDAGLTLKVLELQAQVDVVDEASLEADADKALAFGGLDESGSAPAEGTSILESMYEVSPPADASAEPDPFGAPWTPESDREIVGGDDWFADVVDPDPTGESGDAESGIFGLPLDGLERAEIGPLANSADDSVRRPMVALATILGGAAVTAADESAADMLASLAGQMVGRLPKEPPTLPVPEVLELPSAVAADETTGASPAPLLSFDRFFSGSGSPPRPRVDTPVRPAAMTASDLPSVPPVASPSLSPTFGGVPVIPPPKVTPAPTWAGFDQFVPPAPAPVSHAAPAQPPAPAMPTPTGAFWTPAAVPVIPSTPAPTPPAAPRAVTPPATTAQPTPSASVEPTAEPSGEEQRRTPPSDFHRWLEGLS